MKKIITSGIALMLLCISLFALFSCGEKEPCEEHSVSNWSFDSQRNEEGWTCDEVYYTGICTVCNQQVSKQGQEHNFNESWSQQLTCTQDGFDFKKCGTCGYEEKSNLVESKGHSVETKVIYPTCTEGGYTESICTVCGEEHTVTNHTEARGHSILGDTCQNNGCGKKVSEGLAFEELENGTLKVVGIGTCTDTDLIIPNEHNGKRVAEIAEKAFENNATIKYVTIPATVSGISVKIGKSAFVRCSSLESVFVDCSVIIDDTAFSQCYNLKSAKLSKCQTIGKYSFGYCGNLKKVDFVTEFPTTIGDYAFYSCSSLESISLNEHMELGESVLYDTAIYKDESNWKDGVLYFSNILLAAKGLKGEYTVQEGTVAIAPMAFYSYSSDANPELTKLILPDTLYRIGRYAFRGLDITEIEFTKSVRFISEAAFADCDKLTRVNYTGTLTNWCSTFIDNFNAAPTCFGAALYLNGALLEEVAFGADGPLAILPYAFYGCSSVTSIDLTDSKIECVSEGAFGHCENLTSVTLGDNLFEIGDSAFSSTAIAEISIPDSVTHVKNSAFSGCSSLKTVTFGLGVVEIGKSAFRGCALESATFAAPDGWYLVNTYVSETPNPISPFTDPEDAANRIGRQLDEATDGHYRYFVRIFE